MDPMSRAAAAVTRSANPTIRLAVAAVPLFGWFAADWAGGTTLAVYWFETAVACLFVIARVILHRHWSPRRGHFAYAAPGADRTKVRPSFVAGFAMSCAAFSAAHAVFLAIILLLLDRDGDRALAAVDWRSVALGALWIVGLLAVDFVVDLWNLREWTFERVEQTAHRGLGRILVLHLTIVVGLVAMAVTGAPHALFGVFVVLKSSFAVLATWPRPATTTDAGAPGRVFGRLIGEPRARRFDAAWVTDQARETARREANERPWAPARH